MTSGASSESIERAVHDDVEAYRRKDADPFWNDKKRAWYRRLSANVQACRERLEPAFLDIIDEILSREKPVATTTVFESSQYSMFMEGDGPRDRICK